MFTLTSVVITIPPGIGARGIEDEFTYTPIIRVRNNKDSASNNLQFTIRDVTISLGPDISIVRGPSRTGNGLGI